MKTIKWIAVLVLSLGTMTAFGQASAQTPPSDANTGRPVTDDDIAVLRQDVQADKTEIITRNMNFTEEQHRPSGRSTASMPTSSRRSETSAWH